MYESLQALDALQLNFAPQDTHILNIILACLMFGVALDIKLEDFKKLLKKPKILFIGIFSQSIALPTVTFLLVALLHNVIPSGVALGMILVASCPGGNISNFISSVAKANIALSVSLTAASTFLTIVMTPLNFFIWGSLYTHYFGSHASGLIQPLEINPFEVVRVVFILLGIPLTAGILFAKKLPSLTKKIVGPLRKLSLLLFIAMVVVALAKNIGDFWHHLFYIAIVVFIHNALALATGYSIGRLFKVDFPTLKTLTIETGIHNSGLGLALLLNPLIFPPHLQTGGMLFVTAWWGVWHIVSGLAIALYWSRKKL